ncbi:hypothetical protein [uncultured Clostridium sp.]|uniref:hypothetical protein n=1 Tax=uncultured Clostridium sp. TaxID=59620 RepID=UPI0028E639E6|nr:hypothetical protein [uncultured Clostridium sp.]
MDENMKKHLEFLKEQQKQKEREKRIAFEKERLFSENINFIQHYRFASNMEAEKINAFLDGLPAITPTRPDFSKMAIEQRFQNIEELLLYENKDIWIYCLCGSSELIDLYSYGSVRSFINDFENWCYISAYLVLLFDNLSDFIFVDDNGNIIKSKSIEK